MKTTLNIDDTVMAELKRETARQDRTISDWSKQRFAYCSVHDASGKKSQPCRRSAAAAINVEIVDYH